MLDAILSGGWTWMAGIGGVIAAVLAAWFGGKKVATAQTQAKADVKAAEVKIESARAVAVAQEKVNSDAESTRQDVSRISDSDVDDRLRNEWQRK